MWKHDWRNGPPSAPPLDQCQSINTRWPCLLGFSPRGVSSTAFDYKPTLLHATVLYALHALHVACCWTRSCYPEYWHGCSCIFSYIPLFCKSVYLLYSLKVALAYLPCKNPLSFHSTRDRRSIVR
jgi:hypothetical protein